MDILRYLVIPETLQTNAEIALGRKTDHRRHAQFLWVLAKSTFERVFTRPVEWVTIGTPHRLFGVTLSAQCELTQRADPTVSRGHFAAQVTRRHFLLRE